MSENWFLSISTKSFQKKTYLIRFLKTCLQLFSGFSVNVLKINAMILATKHNYPKKHIFCHFISFQNQIIRLIGKEFKGFLPPFFDPFIRNYYKSENEFF